MKQTKVRSLSASPFQIWTDLAFKTGEMMMASAQVIGHRTNRMMTAGPMPGLRDRREFTLMGQEKIEAATESAQAMATHMLRLNHQLESLALKQLLTGAAAMLWLAVSPIAELSIDRQAKLLRDASAHSAIAASQLSNSAAWLAHQALEPIHSRATGNAKRLGLRSFA